MPLETAISPNLKSPPIESKNRMQFFEDFNSKGFNYCCKKYTKANIAVKMKRRLRNILASLGLLKIIKPMRKQMFLLLSLCCNK